MWGGAWPQASVPTQPAQAPPSSTMDPAQAQQWATYYQQYNQWAAGIAALFSFCVTCID